jgi:hypothetical protein
MYFVDEPIEVDVHIDAGGEVRPLAFTWRGQRYVVSGLGRTRQQGEERYFLVMTAGERIFELCWHIPDNRWRLARASEGRALI